LGRPSATDRYLFIWLSALRIGSIDICMTPVYVQAEAKRASLVGGMQATIGSPMEAQQAAAALLDKISSLAPRTDAQKFVQAKALQLLAQPRRPALHTIGARRR